MAEGRIQGTVTRIEMTKGFCFVRGDNGHDYFTHATALVAPGGLGGLKEGMRVSFIAETTAKGPRALQVHVVGQQAGQKKAAEE